MRKCACIYTELAIEKEKTSNKKQKFEFDADAAKKLAQQAEDEAVRQLEIEQVGSLNLVIEMESVWWP